MLQLYLQDIWWKEEDDIPKKKASGKVKRKEIKNQPHFRGWVGWASLEVGSDLRPLSRS